MFSAEHIDYLNEVIAEVDRMADEDPNVRVADLIDVGFGLVNPADYGVDLVNDEASDAEYEYVKRGIR
jgi:hypothetical protein